MRLPRDVSGAQLVRALRRLGYEPTRQVGSHIRLTRRIGGEQHVTVPDHDPIRPGTLQSILREVARQTDLDRDTLMERLFQ